MSDRRRAARNLITIVILVLIPASLYLIVEQPNFTPGMARFRVEYEYGVQLTQVSEVKLDLDRDRSGWNEAQQFELWPMQRMPSVCLAGWERTTPSSPPIGTRGNCGGTSSGTAVSGLRRGCLWSALTSGGYMKAAQN